MADLSVLYMALSAANTGLCSVFDLLSTDPSHGDFNGALLWYASICRSLLPYNRSLLPYNRSLLPYDRSLLSYSIGLY